ncbi:MAG: S9 family peptidase [Anaerolineae bacterium]|nr:S9 family peptidase [Anaerolineae bacterium]
MANEIKGEPAEEQEQDRNEPQNPPDKHVPTIDELLELPIPDDAQISPDGAYIVHTVTTPDWKQNDYITQLWLVETASPGASRQLTFAKVDSWGPHWAPDGKWLAFLSERDTDTWTQIYRISPFGGEAERLTESETDIQWFEWSPDGKRFAYTAYEPESDAEKDRKEKYGFYHVDDEDYFRTHLWVFDIESKKSQKITGGDTYHVRSFAWHPASNRLAFASWPTSDTSDHERSRIYLVDLDSLEVKPLTGEGCFTPVWSPDGKELGFLRYGAPSYYANNELCIMPIDEAGEPGEARVVSGQFDENIEYIHWGQDGIYFLAVQRTARHLFRIDPATGEYARLTPDEPGWVTGDYSLTDDCRYAALTAGDAAHYIEITRLDRAGDLRRLTDFNDKIKNWKLGRREIFQWASVDGTPIEGILTKPDDFDPEKRCPLLVVVHGGPSSVSLFGLLSGNNRFYYPAELWLDKGALVLEPNYRGSTGYGEAFRRLNVRNLGLGDYEDVVSGVGALIERGWVDPERVGIMGWSQGGYISAFAATYGGARFKAASVGAGPTNWVTDYANTDVHHFTRQYLGATPWDDMDIYQKTSPMTYIKNARTPTLIQHGEYDRRVPIANAYELYQGLKDVGVETRLVIYRGMGHGIYRPRLNRRVLQDNLDWFDRWIWGEPVEEEKDVSVCYVALTDVPKIDAAAGEDAKEKEEAARCAEAEEQSAAARILTVYHWARRDRAEFRVFSGTEGLLRLDDELSERDDSAQDHALDPARVYDIAAKVAEQIKDQKLKKLVVYTREASKHPQVFVYVGALQVAAGIVADSVSVEHKQIDEEEW